MLTQMHQKSQPEESKGRSFKIMHELHPIVMQFAWRPTQGLDIKEGFAHCTNGKLYLAVIGEAIQEQPSAFEQGTITAAAWSPDGVSIAVGSDSAVLRVERFVGHQGFTVQLTSQVYHLLS